MQVIYVFAVFFKFFFVYRFVFFSSLFSVQIRFRLSFSEYRILSFR